MVSADERVEHISIHALRGEGDVQLGKLLKRLADFNPRPPWGGRLVSAIVDRYKLAFQSTPSVGRATRQSCQRNKMTRQISIHALRGEGDPLPQQICCRNGISIHALRGEGDQVKRIISNRKRAISIHALRGEGDENSLRQKYDGAISIHALRGEGDSSTQDAR